MFLCVSVLINKHFAGLWWVLRVRRKMSWQCTVCFACVCQVMKCNYI